MPSTLGGGPGAQYLEKRAEIGMANMPYPRTLPERLRDEKAALEQRLSQVNEAIEALEKNPEIEKILHLISKVW